MEAELKLLIDPSAAEALRRHPLLQQGASGKPALQQLVSTYFDTPDFFLKRQRVSLRVRQADGARIQTLKGPARISAGLHVRDEWETTLQDERPDLASLRALAGHDPYWARLLSDPRLPDSLMPVFSNRINRTVWRVQPDSETEIMLVLDQGELRHESSSLPISEIELELKSGQPSALFDIALQLQRNVPLRLGNASKAERGYGLLAPQPLAAPLKSDVPQLRPDMSVAQGLLAIAGSCAMQIQGNEAGVVQGNDPEYLHQMRVGLRRLHSALKFFGALMPIPPGLQDDAKWLMSELGPARDWEVLAGITLADMMHACGPLPELDQLQQATAQLASQHRRRAAAAVQSERYARLLLELGAWMHGAGRHDPLDRQQSEALAAPLCGFASQVLDRSQKKLRARGKKLRDAEQARHRLRIAAKRMRYAIEFFQSLYPAAWARRHLQALTALQDSLGRLNDASVGRRMLRQLASSRPELALGAGFALGLQAAGAPDSIRRSAKRWRRFRRLPRLHAK
jgi:inorganic triphosphatase YgiF